MKLFCKPPQTESAPEPEPNAITEETAAANAVQEAADRCAALDAEQKSWSARRDQAYRAFVDSLKRHAEAKKKIAAAAVAPVLFATGEVSHTS